MTAVLAPAGAPSATVTTWEAIDWRKAVTEVRQLQMRIAKAYREGKKGKVKALQWILTHSFHAKVMAVKRVVQNRGGKTPGVDGVVWNTPRQRMQAALSLKRRGYRTQPLKRVYIPKKQSGKLRPLSIPVMACRAQQALHLLSLEPIAEITVDKNAYGFRPLRGAEDAIEQCFKSLAGRGQRASYVLKTDIQACFDRIDCQWLLKHVVMDKTVLRKWLTAGYMEKGKLYSTESGTPQGGIISPTLLNVALSGLERAVQAITGRRDKVNVILYADDLVITGATREVLENKVKPCVDAFLKERGLSLSSDKTQIVPIQEGFDFLSMTIRKYPNGKLIIQPAKSSVKRLLGDIRRTIKSHAAVRTEYLIYLLNPKIRGWANYHRHVCSKRTFSAVDHFIFEALWRWAVRRHRSDQPNKGKQWVKKKYFHYSGHRQWVFSTPIQEKGRTRLLELVEAAKTPIRRHIKIKSEATPFDPAYHAYFSKRMTQRFEAGKSRKKPRWWLCWWELI
jgi:RNA-directed DNA polymerase